MTLAALLVPLATALVVALIPTSPLKHAFTIIGTLATFVVALFLGSSPAVETLWIPGFEVYFSLSPAGASGLLVLVASLVMIPAAVYASLTVERHMGAFVALLLLMQAGLNGVFLAKDLVLFYVFWEATLIPSVLMLGIWGGVGRRQAAIKYLMYAVTGSFFMLVAIFAIRPLSGAVSYRLDDLLAVTPALPFPTQLWLFIAFHAGVRGQAAPLAAPRLAARLSRAEPPLGKRRHGGHALQGGRLGLFRLGAAAVAQRRRRRRALPARLCRGHGALRGHYRHLANAHEAPLGVRLLVAHGHRGRRHIRAAHRGA